MLSLCSFPWAMGWEAKTNLNQEMSFFSGIPILRQRANIKKRTILTDMFPPQVISRKTLSPQLPVPLWGWALTAEAAPSCGTPAHGAILLSETASWKDGAIPSG